MKEIYHLYDCINYVYIKDMREIFYRVIYGILSILLFVLLMHLTGQIFGQVN